MTYIRTAADIQRGAQLNTESECILYIPPAQFIGSAVIIIILPTGIKKLKFFRLNSAFIKTGTIIRPFRINCTSNRRNINIVKHQPQYDCLFIYIDIEIIHTRLTLNINPITFRGKIPFFHSEQIRIQS